MRRLFFGLLLIVLAVPGAGADEDSPYLIEKRDFKKQYTTIALSPIYADPVLEMPDSVAAIIMDEVTRHLEKRGYTVLPSSVLGGIRARMDAQVGGTTDPVTGEENLDKLQVVRSHALRELWFRHKFDAIATIRVRANQVPIENDRAKWDGTKQRLEHKGRGGKYTASGWVSSVAFAVYDDRQDPLFVNRGGLEVLMRRDAGQLEVLPAERYFQEEKRIRKAAQIALAPI